MKNGKWWCQKDETIYLPIFFLIIFRLIYIEAEFCSLLPKLYNNDTSAVAYSTKLCLLSYNLENPEHRLAGTKDHLHMFPSIFFFRKTSPLVVEFNRQLQLLQESGLIDYWIKNITNPRKSNEKREPTKLKMTSILAVFQFCGAMYIISIIVFILELISMKSKRIKSIIDYITYWLFGSSVTRAHSSNWNLNITNRHNMKWFEH